jgi:hypothetical protein
MTQYFFLYFLSPWYFFLFPGCPTTSTLPRQWPRRPLSGHLAAAAGLAALQSAVDELAQRSCDFVSNLFQFLSQISPHLYEKVDGICVLINSWRDSNELRWVYFFVAPNASQRMQANLLAFGRGACVYAGCDAEFDDLLKSFYSLDGYAVCGVVFFLLLYQNSKRGSWIIHQNERMKRKKKKVKT